MTAYQPLCPSCRDNSPDTFRRDCSGCQARKAHHEAARALSDAQVRGADSMFQVLPEHKK